MELGQQALLELEPRETVAIPASLLPNPSWWGVDSATGRVNIGWVARDLEREPSSQVTWWRDPSGLYRGVQSVRLPEVDREDNAGRRLHVAEQQLAALVQTMLSEGVPAPGAIWVEAAVGEHPAPSLIKVVGVAELVCFREVFNRYGVAPAVRTLSSTHWKGEVCGHGSFGKKQPRPRGHKGTWRGKKLELEEYKAMQWARLHGYTGGSWDDADALAQAECARKDVAFA
jgi:hypothetical protein